MLLQCYAGLDAFARGYGSRELFTTLGRQLLVSEELCRLGYEPEALADIAEAQLSLTNVHAENKRHGAWQMQESDYAWLCVAFDIYERQLAAASLHDIARSEAQAVEGLMRAGKKAALAESA
jgi:hypothetical protein